MPSGLPSIENWAARTQALIRQVHERQYANGLRSDLPVYPVDKTRRTPTVPESSDPKIDPLLQNFPITAGIGIAPVAYMSSAQNMSHTVAETAGELNSSELKMASALFKNLIGKPNVNWAQVATDAGLKDAVVARTRYSQIRKKHGWNVTEEMASGTPRSGTGISLGDPPKSMVDENGLPIYKTLTPLDFPDGSATVSAKGAKVRKPRTRKDPNTPTKPRKGSKAWLAAQTAVEAVANLQGNDEEQMDMGETLDEAMEQGLNYEM